MQVTVVGGSGFIGTRLCERLAKRTDCEFQIIDKIVSKAFPRKTSLADVTQLESLFSVIPECGIIINLAAEHRDDVKPVSRYDEVNILGAENICLVARKKGIKTIVFTSSVAVYGFAPENTDEHGRIAPFNDYGRTKYEAEKIYQAWQDESPDDRTLVIVRPTVVFGERNRGNVYNLFRQIASDKFLMVGNGQNRKSMAYVENVAAFIEHTSKIKAGLHLYNYIDKPDMSMFELVGNVRRILGKTARFRFRLPISIAYFIGGSLDTLAALTGKKFLISRVRVKKFVSNTTFNTSAAATGFVPPHTIIEALHKTVGYEFTEQRGENTVFYTE